MVKDLKGIEKLHYNEEDHLEMAKKIEEQKTKWG